MSLVAKSQIVPFFLLLAVSLIDNCSKQHKIKTSTIGLGWANNSVNTVIFRGKALTTHENLQFAAYYDTEGKVVLEKRELFDTRN